MIPRVIPPLTDLTVLVTRPAAQAAALCAQIEARGGAAIALPAIAIEALPVEPAPEVDLVIFISANAVAHGAHLVQRGPATKIAAIGQATASALAALNVSVDIVPVLIPGAGADSEALLAHPGLALPAGARALIIRGSGGRELLQTTLSERGFTVELREVYRRVCPPLDAATRTHIETQWGEGGIDVVTITSVETLSNLMSMLSERGVALLRDTPFVAASRRILDAAVAAGITATPLLAHGADDNALIGALAYWRTRARSD
jgi:uroporphyrinogen-III synthase